MKNIRSAILLAWISLMLCSCGKNIFSNGETIEEDRYLESSFTTIEIYDNINVKLSHCNAEHQPGLIHVKTGETLMEGIVTEIEEDDEGNKLVIRNDNTLNFLRPYEYTLEMIVYYDSIQKIIFNSNAQNITTDTLRGYNNEMVLTLNDSTHKDTLLPKLQLVIQGGSGNFNVLTNCYNLDTRYFDGTSTINVRGKSEMSSIYADYNCHGIINQADLEATLLYVTSHGTNTITGKASHTFSAKNDNIGRIYYVTYRKKGKTIHYGHTDSLGHWIPNDTIDTIYYCPQRLIHIGDNIEPYPGN